MAIGIDVEERGALDRYDRAALVALLDRWCDAEERAWCLRQADLAKAAAAALCCKEAAFKALGGAAPTVRAVALDLDHGSARGRAGTVAAVVRVSWSSGGGKIVATAVVVGPDPSPPPA